MTDAMQDQMKRHIEKLITPRIVRADDVIRDVVFRAVDDFGGDRHLQMLERTLKAEMLK